MKWIMNNKQSSSWINFLFQIYKSLNMDQITTGFQIAPIIVTSNMGQTQSEKGKPRGMTSSTYKCFLSPTEWIK